jgi:hypothetical protein
LRSIQVFMIPTVTRKLSGVFVCVFRAPLQLNQRLPDQLQVEQQETCNRVGFDIEW